MKRVLTCCLLGISVICFLFIGGLRTNVHLNFQAQQNLSVLATQAMKLTDHVKLWLSDYVEEGEPVISTVNVPAKEEGFIDYDAALEILHEMIGGIEHLLTLDQKEAIEKEVNELYKQSILKQYKNEVGPKFYE